METAKNCYEMIFKRKSNGGTDAEKTLLAHDHL